MAAIGAAGGGVSSLRVGSVTCYRADWARQLIGCSYLVQELLDDAEPPSSWTQLPQQLGLLRLDLGGQRHFLSGAPGSSCEGVTSCQSHKQRC